MSKSDVDRNRRYRARQRGQLVPASVEIPYSLTEKLIECGVLTDEQAANHYKRSDALNVWVLNQIRNLA